MPGEILGTLVALIAAVWTFQTTHSYIAAAASGWVGEGLGFYGYFIASELIAGGRRYSGYTLGRRIVRAIRHASTNMLVEFAPAEVLDNFLIRPFALYAFPQHIHPYIVGFLAGKFSADALFYVVAVGGYEVRKRWLKA